MNPTLHSVNQTVQSPKPDRANRDQQSVERRNRHRYQHGLLNTTPHRAIYSMHRVCGNIMEYLSFISIRRLDFKFTGLRLGRIFSTCSAFSSHLSPSSLCHQPLCNRCDNMILENNNNNNNHNNNHNHNMVFVIVHQSSSQGDPIDLFPC